MRCPVRVVPAYLVEAKPYRERVRDPLDVHAVRSRLGSFVTRLDVVAETASTNADLLRAASAGAAEGTVLVAEFQSAGRGRLERVWSSPPGAGLTFSLLLRPAVAPARWGWLPLLTGVALRAVVQGAGVTDATLKWPNDLLLGPRRRKTAGILAQAGAGTVVVGVGLNVTTTAAELPGPAATSPALERPDLVFDRTSLLAGVLSEFGDLYRDWTEASGDADRCGLRERFRGACDTLGRDVRVALDHRPPVDGRAVDVDADGALVVVAADGTHVLPAGEVQTVRPAP